MIDYYNTQLSGERLRQCYDLATPRIRQYLRAEIEMVLQSVASDADLLELGCGYGRFLLELYGRINCLTGIDTSLDSLRLARKLAWGRSDLFLAAMNALSLGFEDESFDTVICVQNGISAFHVSPTLLMRESMRVCRKPGTVIFTSYSDRIWDDRLRWFELQSRAGLVGAIDYERTGNGVIVCNDGFTATTFRPGDFRSLAEELNVNAEIFEIDSSALVCRINLS